MDDPARQTSYFNYFTEIEEQFLRRRGGGLLLSALDWALIETWKDAEIPLEAVLRGIDEAFDRYDERRSKRKKINSLAYCSQAVLSAAADMKEAAVGAANDVRSNKSGVSRGLEPETIAAFLRRNAEALIAANPEVSRALSIRVALAESSDTLRQLAEKVVKQEVRLEDLERRLTVLEEKIFAAVLGATEDEEIVAVRTEADRDLAAYRSKMSAAQIEQLHKQYVHKRLLEKFKLPRLSLFYM